MVVPAFLLVAWGVVSAALSARRYARDIGGGERFVTAATIRTAFSQALSLAYLRGGGAGCYDEDRRSGRRRFFHGFVFWGVLADFAATTCAAIAQEFMGFMPPYPLWSPPVVLGAGGGVAIAIGAAGLIAVKRRSDPVPMSDRMIALDYAFLGMLEAAALTGLALLAFRSTAAMGTLLAIHLGTIAGMFVTAPYGKFIHFVYRSISLVKHAHERESEP
jgi:citrate/tricarballylate utilization protein